MDKSKFTVNPELDSEGFITFDPLFAGPTAVDYVSIERAIRLHTAVEELVARPYYGASPTGRFVTIPQHLELKLELLAIHDAMENYRNSAGTCRCALALPECFCNERRS